MSVPVGVLLGVIGAVKVLAGEVGLRAGHVAPDDEMRRAVVAPQDHVLQRKVVQNVKTNVAGDKTQ